MLIIFLENSLKKYCKNPVILFTERDTPMANHIFSSIFLYGKMHLSAFDLLTWWYWHTYKKCTSTYYIHTHIIS